MAGNKDLRKANKEKKAEFYTQLSDIEKELRHYSDEFKGKVIYCNCDDPYESNFFKYFAMSFNQLGLKKLIATCYSGSPIVYTQLSLFGDEKVVAKIESDKKPYKIEITEVTDLNGDGAIDLADVELLLKSDNNTLTLLEGNGDFRSDECIELLKECDIVVTNPPFPLFREYITQLVEYDKKFIIIGNKNAITYKEVFSLLAQEKMWLGYRNINDDMWFIVPENYDCEKIIDGIRLKHIYGCWFTNLDTSKRHVELTLYKKYNPEEFPRYDNYEAINVNKVADIPYDYDGLMGVPITFFDKFNPEQFEIVDALNRYSLLDVLGTNEKVKKERSHTCNINGKPTYFRIIIKRRKKEC